MRFKIYLEGRVKEKFFLEGEKEYLKRFKDVKLELIEVKKDILSRIPANDYLVVLDERGKAFSSIEFSRFVSGKFNSGVSTINFAIGGADGWNNEVRERADLLLSLSALTFPHQMVRLILIEQLYRVMTIINSGSYHR